MSLEAGLTDIDRAVRVMPERHSDPNESESAVNRRRVLAALGATAVSGLAGCGGGGDDGSGGGSGGAAPNTQSMGDTTTPQQTQTAMDTPTQTATETEDSVPGIGGGGELSCSDLAGSYRPLTPGDTRLIYRSEYPEAYGEAKYDISSASATNLGGLTAKVGFFQSFESNSTPIPERDGYEPFMETTFNGQTRAVGLRTELPNVQGIAVQAEALVSGTYDGSEERFRIRILHNVIPNDDTDMETCRSTLTDGVRHAFETLEPNPETTIAESL
jgi:hypothetical protein